MAGPFLSAEWHRVSQLRLRLRSHVEIHRQVYRGGVWYLIQDHHNERFHRVSPAANLMLNMMDGRRPVQVLWETACDRFPDDPPTQDEVIRLLGQLHNADLISGEAPPDLVELSRRADRQARRNLLQKIRNPLSLRVPLFDPDAFLTRTAWLARPIFTIWGLLAWLTLVVTGGVLTVLYWSEITGDIIDRVLTIENLFLVLIAYPIVKAVHELGHAYATKVWGGEVHDIGIMFLVLIPVPYVDASSSSAFPNKWRRAVVGGAGIMVELALASLAVIFWLNAEPGFARALAFNVMLIGGVSTLFFNGNPLLRFDGYFVLCDIIEVPNLATRANKHVHYLIKKHAFGKDDVEGPATARGEAAWFTFYAIAAAIYRIFIALLIALFIASKFFFIGVILAIWSLWSAFAFPLLKGLWYVVTSPQLRGRRQRAVGAVVGVVAGLFALMFFTPLPYGSIVQGVVWMDDQRVLRAGAEGFVAGVAPGDSAEGGSILRLEDPALSAEEKLLRSRLEEMRLRLRSVTALDPAQERILRAQAEHLEDQLERVEAKAASLTLNAAAAGEALVPRHQDLPGRLLSKGDEIGYLLDGAPVVVRVAAPQADADLILRRTEGVTLRFASDLATEHKARVLRETPGGAATLPSLALATEGGGPFALDPTDAQGLRALDVAFQFDIALIEPIAPRFVGERVYVRFDHGWEPIAPRLWRAIRQLFLSRFNV